MDSLRDRPNLILVERSWCVGAVDRLEQRSQRAWRVQTAGGRGYFLKLHLDQQASAAYPVLRQLADQGMRVEVPLPTVNGGVLAEHRGQFFALYEELPGEPVDVHGGAAPLRTARALGAAIGQLHRGLAACSDTMATPLPRACLLADTLSWATRLQCTIGQSNAAWLGPVVAELDAALGGLGAGLPRQLVHNDCHSGNVIVDGFGVPGFIDFDFMRINLRIFDPCYCLAFLLVDGMGRRFDLDQWPDLQDRLLAGYDSICPLQVAERAVITYIVWAALLINAGWWLQADRHDLSDANLRALRWLTGVGS